MKLIFLLLTTLVLVTTSVIADVVTLHHRLGVSYQPKFSSIQVTDTLKASDLKQLKSLQFLLHAQLSVNPVKGAEIKLLESNVSASDKGMDQESFDADTSIVLNRYQLTLTEGSDEVTLEYSGNIHHVVAQQGEEYARGFSSSPGLIDQRGVYLAGSTYWVPSFGDEYLTYDLTIHSSNGWRAVSQGKRTVQMVSGEERTETWRVDTATEEIFLIAAKFTEYQFDVGAVKAMAFLRTPDEGLANKYLETTAQYLEMYRNMLGPYPYSKFALVENFWETGYGMPSFTLLGEKIIRFPFILHSSYPHELLHNWWGNGVYVDFETGNWCEGLTAYMADHLIAEQRGTAAEYRRSTLQKYTDYVDQNSDFPLSQFRSRSSPASEAVGYGKSAMMWDMLRERVGDKNFIRAFQQFYQAHKYKRASFNDIRLAFEKVVDDDLSEFFNQWLTRKGAPELSLDSVIKKKESVGYSVTLNLKQTQAVEAYTLSIPVAIYSVDDVEVRHLEMTAKQQPFKLQVSKEPIKIEVDPQFNLFRKLHYTEIPPSLSKAFGAQKVLIVLPTTIDADLSAGYQKFVDFLRKGGDKYEVVSDQDLDSLPTDSSIWLLGWNNRFRTIIDSAVEKYGSAVQADKVKLGRTSLSKKTNSLVVTVRHPKNPDNVVVWVNLHDNKAADGLARKLPHYGKYSYLGFTGDEPSNVAKGQWSTIQSPMTKSFTSETSSAKLPKRKALAKLAPVFKAKDMLEHVNYLASDKLKGRGLGTPEIRKAADYIAAQLKQAGIEPAGDNGSYFQAFDVKLGKEQRSVTLYNVLGVIPGSNTAWQNQSVVISAHYDHLGTGWPESRPGDEGKIHPGADDNASGVAVLLELAKSLSKSKLKRNIIVAAFSGEEFGLLGARYYVANYSKYPASKSMGVVNMDTVGRLGDNKLLVLGGSSAREWKFIMMGTSFVTGVPTEMVTQELDTSDQVAFIEKGIPGIHLFSGSSPDYHKPTDSANKIDGAGLVKVAVVAKEVITYLAERAEAMNFTGASNSSKTKLTSNRKVRRVSTGIMPDFTFSGKGMRVGAVSDESPAAKASLKNGDVIYQVNDIQTTDLRSYSDALKQFKPGDKITVHYRRNDQTYSTSLVLTTR